MHVFEYVSWQICVHLFQNLLDRLQKNQKSLSWADGNNIYIWSWPIMLYNHVLLNFPLTWIDESKEKKEEIWLSPLTKAPTLTEK